MPQAKKSSTRSRTAFREPAALKRLNKSLETAQAALSDLGKGTSRDVSKGAQDLHKNVRAFLSSARRDTGKLAKALQKDFDRAQTQIGASRSSSSARTATASRRTAAKKPAARRTAAKKPATRRAAAKPAAGRTTSKAG